MLGVFEATTPCDEVSKSLLQIPLAIKCEMMKWALTLYQDPRTSGPTQYTLVYTYGMPKQGTRGFMEGATTVELTGRWTVDRATKEHPGWVIYQLKSDKSRISLNFLNPNQNLLHLLDSDKNLMVGTGAWSYTLNRRDPVNLSPNEIQTQKVAVSNISSDSVVFNARTPCYEPLLALFGKPVTGCQLIKCQLVLYQEAETHKPTSFKLYTVHVGTGDNKYLTSGKWMVIKGTKSDPQAIVYELQTGPEKSEPPIRFLKGDDNILFMLDKDMNLMTGNSYCSYTFNRKR